MTRTLLALASGAGASVTTGSIIRSTASGFPLSEDNYPGATTVVSGITLGPQGDIVLVTSLVVGTNPVSTVIASNTSYVEFTRVGSPYTDASWSSGSSLVERWSGVVTAAGAGASGVSITVTYSGSETYTLVTVDALESNLGATTNWVHSGVTGVTNSTATTLAHPALTASVSVNPKAYYSYLQVNNVSAGSVGTNPINGQTFAYTPITVSDSAQIAFCGSLQSSASYQPVGNVSATTPSFGIAETWTATTSPASLLTVASVSNQSASVGTAITTIPISASGGTTPYAYSAASLPAGISISPTTGSITGTPTTAQATRTTTVTVNDSSNPEQSDQINFGFTVATSSGGIVPAYSPPGGVGALLFNADFSTLTNQAGAGPMFRSSTGSTNNGITASDADANIVSGQLVLTLSGSSTGGQVTTCSDGTYPAPSNGGFEFTYGYVEVSVVMPSSGWWAVWLSGQSWPSHGEFDIAENLGSGPSTNYHGTSSGAVYNGGAWSSQPSVGSTFVAGGLWKSGVVTSYNNGVLQKTLTTGEGNGITISSNNEFILLTMGNSGYSVPQTLKVNYVRVWALP